MTRNPRPATSPPFSRSSSENEGARFFRFRATSPISAGCPAAAPDGSRRSMRTCLRLCSERIPETTMLASNSPSTRNNRLFPVLIAATPMPLVRPMYHQPILVILSLRRQAGVGGRAVMSLGDGNLFDQIAHHALRGHPLDLAPARTASGQRDAVGEDRHAEILDVVRLDVPAPAQESARLGDTEQRDRAPGRG